MPINWANGRPIYWSISTSWGPKELSLYMGQYHYGVLLAIMVSGKSSVGVQV